MKQPILEMKNIHKSFPGTVALDDVSLTVFPGEIRGLIGENGSGKSTLSSIAAGILKADRGEMIFQTKPWAPRSMIEALRGGIGMIVQESGTIPGISVAENMFLAEVSRFKQAGYINKSAMIREANEVLAALGIDSIKGDMSTASLDFQARKVIEIAKVAMKEPKLLVIDETTTALSQEGREILYRLVRKYKQDERAVLFISHDLEEIMQVCDSLTVLRDGRQVRDFNKSEFSADTIRTSMIGREIKGDYYRSDVNPSAAETIALRAEKINVANELKDIDLTLRAGEIVGIGGLSHCGMHTLGKVLFGAISPDSGSVMVGENIIRDEHSAIQSGMGYVAKDRDTESLTLSASVQDNIAIAGMDVYDVAGFLILNSREKDYVDDVISDLSIKCSRRDQPVSQLSGGNKQKVVFGKWIGCGSEILILDCPTRGVDVGVKQAMYNLMTELKAQGKSILMISEEMPELIGVSDRLIIMKDGRITAEFERGPELTEADIVTHMI